MKCLPKTPLDSTSLERGIWGEEGGGGGLDAWANTRRNELPSIQAEQVEDDVAPVTAEYVPAQASDEELRISRFEDESFGVKMGTGT
jgi:hypothetical protein